MVLPNGEVVRGLAMDPARCPSCGAAVVIPRRTTSAKPFRWKGHPEGVVQFEPEKAAGAAAFSYDGVARAAIMTELPLVWIGHKCPDAGDAEFAEQGKAKAPAGRGRR